MVEQNEQNTAIDYKAEYDHYWQFACRIGDSSADMERIAEQIVTTCGLGRTLDIGCGEGLLVQELLRQGVDAHGVDVSQVVVSRCNEQLPGRFTCASVLELPFKDGAFKTLVSTDCLEHLAPADVPQALKELHRVAERFVFLRITTELATDTTRRLTIEKRPWWEAKCFEAGFRKHPLYYQVNPYESLNQDAPQICVLLEKIPEATSRKFGLNSLAAERMLHNDMLRETGRISDAHCIRYYKAAQYVRPGDRVLDVACGLGYGTYILFYASQAASAIGIDSSEFAVDYARANYRISESIDFATGDAQNLSNIPDHSIDFIAAFETIEHLEDPIAYLRELKRVLKPAGRIMVCAPNEWVDETGKDPNPHHLHVYTWERLLAEVSSFFLPERGILQVAGGALKCPNGERAWQEFPVDHPPQEESEWVLLLAMSDPVAGKGIPYQETTWKLPDSPEFHVAAFGRDYANPWLVKGMVAMGLRINSENELAQLQERVLSSAKPESVDYGAALCVRIYAHLQESHLPATAIKEIEQDVRRYAAIPEPSPHQLRWQISLLYAAGELARLQGRLDDARTFYSECAVRDALPYSPLLGNKTLDALFWLAKFALTENDAEAARSHLQRSIEEARRLAQGSWLNIVGAIEKPLAFGLPEVAQLLDKAARAAYMLSVIEQFQVKPFLLAQESTGYFERHLDHYKNRSAELDRWVTNLNTALTERDAQIAERDAQIAERDAQIFSLNHMLTYARANLQLLEGSWSWRITKPLRWCKRFVQKVLWCLSRFESVWRTEGLLSAVSRAKRFIQTRMPSPVRWKAQHSEPQNPGNLSLAQELWQDNSVTPTPCSPPAFMLVETFHDGGVERVVIDLCLQFRRLGRPSKILVAKDGGRSAQEAKRHGIEVIEFLHNHSLLQEFLRAHKKGIVITHHCYFALKQFHEANLPIVEVVHNAYHWQKGNHEIEEYRHRFISRFIAVSEFVKNFSVHELGINPNSITLINNGLSNVDLIRPPLEILRKNRIHTLDTPVLLYLANLHPQKNPRLVVHAFAQVKCAYPKARLIMAGAMDGYPELHKTLLADIKRLGIQESTLLAGALDRRELSKIMASAHIGLLPTMLEGFSIATLEFTFFGLPSVFSATGASNELKRRYGHIEIAQGCAVPQDRLSVNTIETLSHRLPEDAVSALSDAILKIMGNYSEYLEKSLAAGEDFPAYSVEHTAEQYNQLLKSLEG